ncbi:MAG TPA: hypothetical protein VLA31_06005, partial [Burkholderiaceae bacterium]|nr:hypothetical protein [Burkholderiaceae bacterium]
EAEGMSLNTSLMAWCLPFDDARQHLASTLGFHVNNAMMAFLYCEATKLLRHEGVLRPLEHYENDPESYTEAMASPRASSLVRLMAELEPMSVSEPSETEEVRSLFPSTRENKHTHQKTLARWRQLVAGKL